LGVVFIASLVGSMLGESIRIVVVGVFSVWIFRKWWDLTPEKLDRESRKNKLVRTAKFRNVVSFVVVASIATFAIGSFILS